MGNKFLSKFPGREDFTVGGHTYTADKLMTVLGGHMPTPGIRRAQKDEREAYGDEDRLQGDEMPGKLDEKLWAKAKAQAKKQYPDKDADSPSLWKIVSTIYKKMGGKFSKDVKKALDFMDSLERITPSFVKDSRLWLKAVQKAGGSLTAPEKALENLGLTIKVYAEFGGRLQKSSMQDSSPEEVRRRNIGASFQKAETPGGQKPHAYIDRTPAPGGGWKYQYKDDHGKGPKKEKQIVPNRPKGPGDKKEAPEGMARAIEHLNKKTAKDQKASLQNVSPDALAALDTHAPAKSSLKQVVAQEVTRRKEESARKNAPKKTKDETEKSQADPAFEDFRKSWQGDIEKSLSIANPEWDSKTLNENTEAQLRQLYKRG